MGRARKWVGMMGGAATAISPMTRSGEEEEAVELGVFADTGVLVVVGVRDEATVTALRRVMRSAATGWEELSGRVAVVVVFVVVEWEDSRERAGGGISEE